MSRFITVKNLKIDYRQLNKTKVSSELSSDLPRDELEGSIQVVLRLLRNIVKEPGNDKFRKIRMSNPKIREAVDDVSGGVELLEHVGFALKGGGGEMFAVMDVPERDKITLINRVIMSLEPAKMDDVKTSDSVKKRKRLNQRRLKDSTKLDHIAFGSIVPFLCFLFSVNLLVIWVFFSVPESVAAKIELPDSFYNLSADELKREAELRRKKIAESKLLIPKLTRKRRQKQPGGGVLVVRSDSGQTASDTIFSGSRTEASNTRRGGFGPSALIKFKPIETDFIVFTGLSNELSELSEPLVTN
ncbi:hypothetical protein F3Y22_tig00110893pilonHSYRG00675 [Hibiscus syriacus]|uniref:PUB domain-containing protein n=1 Tax=Hibiscus syriacus TaxID=106335 RepID=A0A6A2ZH12_HIBSY|nr:hypothetical protein F3Y22_tig00110893pilonHSYRG00675 [Hibiscus syriacus]